MSDTHYDALRASGVCPPKGWGWQDTAYQRREVARRLAAGEREPWLITEAARLHIALPTRHAPLAADSMPLAKIGAYLLPGDATIDRVSQREGDDRWAVRRHGNCLNQQGEWEFEPTPSDRDDDFLARCRFATAEAAYVVWARSAQ